MSGQERLDDDDERIDSLVHFGFNRDDIAAFLAEHNEAIPERLAWLEDRRETASSLEDRIVAFSQHAVRGFETLEEYRPRLLDPFTIETTFLEFERDLRILAPWEPPLNKSKATWFGEGQGDTWTMIYERLAALDVSSHAAVSPLHRLFVSPQHADELLRHLELVEGDEQRQRAMVQRSAEHLRALGYALGGLDGLPLLESLSQLERWQHFHARKEQIRLSAVQMIQPFDEALAAEFELRCSQLLDKENEVALTELLAEVNEVAQTLEQRRQLFSDRIREWRRQGIVFPHEGELHPGDLMQWEANHDTIAASIQRHLALIERWSRFARYWPSQVEGSKALLGHLDMTDELQNAVDELDALWKQVELDGLELLQSYEHAGLTVTSWQQRVLEDPLSAMERMTLERERWDRRVSILQQLDDLDTSFDGDEEVLIRRQLVATEALQDDVLEEMEAYVQKFRKRNERHRVMLDEELAKMRRSGVLEHETMTDRFNLRELEEHVANLTRTGGASHPANASMAAAKRIQEPLLRELTALVRAGWSVGPWMELMKHDPVRVARELSEARPHLEHHDVLRRRLAGLPWERDVALGLDVEMQVKVPSRLNELSRRIPQFTAHLATRPIEDASYRLHLWQPERTHPTLVPVPELEERPVLQPVTALDEAHDAMLEAMDDESGPDETEVPATPAEPEVEQPEADTVSEIPAPAAVEENMDEVLKVHEPEAVERETVQPAVVVSEKETPEVSPEEEVTPAADDAGDDGAATQQALAELKELVALLGLSDLAHQIAEQGMGALPEVRRGLAQHVNIVPRDVRIARLLRLTLRLLPEGNGKDKQRSQMLMELARLIAPLKRWMRRRLEARHSGASGEFLDDAVELGIALERIPGLGRHLPLGKDDWALPSELNGLSKEVKKLAQSVNLPSAGGVKA